MFQWLRRRLHKPRETPPLEIAGGPQPIEVARAHCQVCGNTTTVRSYEPIDFPCKRNSFFCDGCGSCARNRHIAQTILARFPTDPPSKSLGEFAQRFHGVIWQTCTSGAIAEKLRGARHFISSEF